MAKKAVVISYNWETDEVWISTFDGEQASARAMNWIRPDSFILADFPASEGWTHLALPNKEAAKERTEEMMKMVGGSLGSA